MPVPKRRTTPSKRGMRRSQHDKVAAPNVVPCGNCSAPSLPHRVCKSCGHYGSRSVLKAPDEATESAAGSNE